jgi:hypothetical protein
MVENRREGWQSPRSVNDLLVFRTANTAGGVNQSGDSRAGAVGKNGAPLMFELLPDMPLPAKFFVAFVVVLALIALTAWLVRRLGANRLGGSATRGRQPRLAVIDAASVDGRRRLVLIRRDNIEHLLMIGGPTDVVVEQNIVRVSGARDGREQARTAGPGDSLPRTVPLGDNNGWPLQPSVEIAPAPAMPPAPPPMQPQAPLRATRVAPAEDSWTPPPPEPPRPRAPQAVPPPPAPQPDPAARLSAPDLTIPPPPPLPEVAAEPAPEPAPQTDRNLAEMAQRLEAALRRPAAETKTAGPDPFSIPASPRVPEPPRAAPRDSAPSGEQPASSSKTPFDSLEQEMANLLGRPANKT